MDVCFEAYFQLFILIFFIVDRSVVKAIYKAQWKGPTACVSYCSLGLGILLATFPTSPRMRFIGIALCISGCALLVVLRYIFSYMMSDVTKQALNGDFKDIGKTFGMDPVDNGEKTEEYAPSGSSGFCVAEAYQKGSEINKSRTKIVGFVGIGILNDSKVITSRTRPNLIRIQSRIVATLIKPMPNSAAWWFQRTIADVELQYHSSEQRYVMHMITV